MSQVGLAQDSTTAAAPAREEARRRQCAQGREGRGDGLLWLDDCQVCAVSIEKWIAEQGAAPGVAVTVEAIDAGLVG